MKKYQHLWMTFLFLLSFTFNSYSQTPGLIYKQAGSALGRSVLDPNGDGYTSLSSAGFSGTDYGTNSELNMVPLPIMTAEPVGDLTTGGSGGTTDLVSFGSNTNQSCYIMLKTVSGVQYVVVRFRIGGASTSSKGYSLLMDVDGIFGSQYPTKNNPGFEKEIVLETGNSGMVAIYTHNASGSTLTNSYTIDNYHQRSIALSTVSSDADYFYDFFVPYADLGLTTEPVRIAAVTITSASSGLSGTVSDFNGINDKSYGNNPTAIAKALVNSFPAVPLSSLTSGYTYPAAITLAPVVNSGLTTASTSISGTSTEADGTTITVYKNGSSIGTATVSGNTWTLSGVSGLVAGDLITATATASGKTGSSTSNTITVTAVKSCYVNAPDIVSATNSGSKKITVHWSWPSGVTKTANTVQVIVYQLSVNGSGSFSVVGSSPQYLSVNASDTIQYSLGGAGSVTGSYVAQVVYGGCTSGYSSSFVSSYGGTSDIKTTAPTVLTSPIYQNTGSTSVSVKNNNSTTANLVIYVNGVSKQTVNSVLANANGSFTLNGLLETDVIWARAVGTGTNYVLSDTSNNVVVIASSVQSDAPAITGSYTSGSNKTISGTSTEQSGTTIYVYAGTTLLGTTTVTIYGTWSLSGVTLSAGNVLTAKAKANGETLSDASNAVTVAATIPTAPTVTGSYQANGTSVTGTGGSGTVTVYVDGAPIGTVASSGSWTLNGVTAGQLYKGAKITATNTVSGVESPLSNEVVVTGVTSFIITQTNDAAVGTQTAGVAFNVKFTAKDGANGTGNTVTTFTSKVVVTSTSAALAGTGVSGSFTSGVLSPVSMNLTTAGTGKNISVVSVDDPTATGTTNFDIVANSTTSFELNQPADITAGNRAAYTITRKDAYGNLVTSGNQTVYLYSNSANGKMYDAASNGNLITSIVIPNGSSSVGFWFGSTTAAAYTVTISDANPADGNTGIPDVQDAINVNTSTASKYIVSVVSSTGVNTTVTVTAQLADQYDNYVSTSGNVVAWTSTNGGSFSASNSNTNGSGVATISFTVSSTSSVTHVVTATTGSVTGSASVTTVEGTIASLELNHPADIAAVNRAAYTITRKDSYGNLVTSGNQTVYIYASSANGKMYDAASNGNLITSIVIPNGSSSVGFWFTSTTAGAYTVTISDANPADGNTGIPDVADDINVTAATASKYLVSVVSSTGVNTTVTVTAQLADQYDNYVSTSGNVVAWTSTNGGSFSASNSNTNGSGVATISFTVSATAAVTHVVTATTGAVSGNASVLTIGTCTGYTWTGAANDDNYNNTANWLCGVVPPTSGASITVNPDEVCPLMANVSVEDIDFKTGSSCDLAGYSLTINGQATGKAIFRGNTSSDLTIGSGATIDTIFFETGYQQIHNLAINASVALGSALYVTAGITPGTLTVGSGATFKTNDNLTIGSNYDGTARVGKSLGTITGKVAVERYTRQNTNRGWRLLAVPTYGTQTIKDAWQEGQSTLANNRPGYGTLITSNRANATSYGFDDQTYGNSMLSYIPGYTPSWSGMISNTSTTNIATTSAWMLYIRGDRSIGVSTSITGSGATVLRTKGQLYQHDQTVNLVPGFNIVGNLYASEIDFNNIQKTGSVTNDIFYVWDPILQGSYGLGGYQTISLPDFITPGGGSYTGVSAASLSKIQSGMGFMVYANGSASLTLNEDSKSNGGNGHAYNFRPNVSPAYLRTNLYAVVSGTPTLADGNLVAFNDSYSNSLDGYDAIKATNMGEGIGMYRSGQLLAIERRMMPVNSDSIEYRLSGMKSMNYTLEFVPIALTNPNIVAVLEDKYLSTSQQVSLTDTTRITFVVNTSVSASYSNRFKLSFKNAATLPLRISSFTAKMNNAAIDINWKVENETGVVRYDVEESSDGITYAPLTSVMTSGVASYKTQDIKPENGYNYYRIKIVSAGGAITYSNVICLNNRLANGNLKLMNTLISGNAFTLQLSNQQPGKYLVKLLNNAGALLSASQHQYSGGVESFAVTVPNLLSKGLYHVQVTLPDNTKKVLQIINK